jgi:hypothetical protein
MRDKYSLERIYSASVHLHNVLAMLKPIYTIGDNNPDFMIRLGIVKMILDDVYKKESEKGCNCTVAGGQPCGKTGCDQ